MRGTTRYYQGEEVFTFLQPWLATLASRVIEKRKPLYQLDPADWEIRVLSQLAPISAFPKLPTQVLPFHRCIASLQWVAALMHVVVRQSKENLVLAKHGWQRQRQHGKPISGDIAIAKHSSRVSSRPGLRSCGEPGSKMPGRLPCLDYNQCTVSV